MAMRASSIMVVLLVACGGEPAGPPPFAKVPGTLAALAVNDLAVYGLDSADGTIVEIGLDGTVRGRLPTTGAVSELVAAADWVAWVEAEGTGKIVCRQQAAMDCHRGFDPHIAGSLDGLFFSDAGLIAAWSGDVPERIATPAAGARLLAADASFAYTVEADTSVARYARGGDTAEILVPASMDAVVKDGQLAHRTTEGIRLRDLATGFDRVVGAPPAAYPCPLLIAGRAVMCGRYRAMDGMLAELLVDPVAAYAARARQLYWVSADDETSAIHRVDDVELAVE